jgi:lipopolysaccharide transport system ATP-binding protein
MSCSDAGLKLKEIDTGPETEDRPADSVVSVRGVGKCYNLYRSPQDRLKEALCLGRRSFHTEFWALKDVSVDVQKGTTLGIVGRNGSGKSTLLQIICGTLSPTLGEVYIRGRVAALLELGAGFNVEFSGRENVYMNASILGLSKSEIDEKYDDIVRFAELGQFIDQPVKTYSSGMYVRLAFAIAAHVDADVLVIDEALAVGDAFFVQKCMRFLRRFQEEGTIIFVSHDTGAVINLCDRALLLENGLLKMEGSPKEVCDVYLESYFAENQETRKVARLKKCPLPIEPADSIDQRIQYINSSTLRNDIEVFCFDPDSAAFGQGNAQIVHVRLVDVESGSPIKWMVGGEKVSIIVDCLAHRPIHSPIIGFFVRDRLGQTLFGDNTYLSQRDCPLRIHQGECFTAEFMFRMPILPVGEYSLTVAVAEGTQQNHIQHHWIHDALFFKSHTSSVCTGLVGIAMESIVLKPSKSL